MKPWYLSKENIAALLTLAINVLNVLLQSPIVPPQIMAAVSSFVLPVLIFVLRTWFTSQQTTAPLGLFKAKSKV